MGIDDKADAKGDKLKGKVDEVIGKITDDESRVVKGKAEQAEGSIKDTVADVKAHGEGQRGHVARRPSCRHGPAVGVGRRPHPRTH